MKQFNVGWLGALWLIAGCTVPGDLARTCSSDADCQGVGGTCDVTVGFCYAPGTEIETQDCSPSCAAYEACTKTVCKPRFTTLKILSPADNATLGTGTVEVKAQLSVDPTYAATTQYPDTLVFQASRSGGGATGTLGSVTRNGDTYTAVWTPPATDGQFTLTVAYPTAAAVQSAAVTVQLDTAAPTLTLSFSNPPARAEGAANQADQRDPASGYNTAFRRDEPVTVTVSATEPVNTVMLTVVGIGPNGTPGQAQMPVAVQPGGACSGSPVFCGSAIVDLSGPEMSDVRGTMDFQVEGQDAAGNKGSASAGLKVTRWKWAFDASGEILGTPAIGNKGTIYFGTKFATNGKTIALAPDGARRWEYPTGDVLGSPAVGDFVSNEENVYVAAKSAANVPTLYALRGVAGTERVKCTYNGTSDFPSAVAVGMTQGTLGLVETGVTLYSGSNRVVGIRPSGVIFGGECIDVSGSSMPLSIAGGAVVMKDQSIFYGTTDFKVTSYDLASGNNSPRAGWPQATSYLARGLALAGTDLYGSMSNSDVASQGGVFSIPIAGGALSSLYPGTPASRVFNFAIGSGDAAFFGAETASTRELLALSLTTAGAITARTGSVGTIRGAPAIARNGHLYTLNTQGQVAARTASTLASLWTVDLATAPGTADVSPALDCRRDASGQGVTGLGTVYVPTSTKLYAFVVDSPGLDPAAPWPKYQHDARNTGNPATPITNCP